MDLYFFNLINQFAGRWEALDNIVIFLADKFGYILVALIFILFWQKWKIIIKVFSAAILARLVIVNMIRWILPRTRPFVENQVNQIISQNPFESSFPSGHAAFYFAIAIVAFLSIKKVYPVSNWRFWCGVGPLFIVAAFLISVARVFGGIHWPSDILAGAIVGILSGWLVVRISRKIVR